MFLNLNNTKLEDIDFTTMAGEQVPLPKNFTSKVKVGKLNQIQLAYFKLPNDKKIFYLGDSSEIDGTMYYHFFNSENDDLNVEIYVF
ncbi:hypothetical protein ACIQ61_25275 [Bacillus cereus]|uniref:hypothetical protein n=1 Tax=Bacillus cereus TaxID=1396 RepID=UPI0037F91611